ncbi:hypothetical protein NHX12_012376 [Muraenolepis orangiensis]|uniref:Uncharacterized protein n=1 Tax=Muraenolepis orangiensis TaxID=630683 RepID=A0A9Q0I5U8_9TELE|nr:hypothetical protein NHX12_012376 [Muraenolepis orangiensis]
MAAMAAMAAMTERFQTWAPFKEVKDPEQLMFNFDTLTQTKAEILDRAKLAEFVRSRQQATDVQQNALGQLMSELNMVQADRMVKESRLTHLLDTAAEETLQVGNITATTLSLTQTLTKIHGPPVDPEDTVEQLEQINLFIQKNDRQPENLKVSQAAV